ncbi:MAG: UPF0175 family protein [Pyrinomonadaceae bacterium]
MQQLTIEYPDDLLIALGVRAEQFEHEARLTLAAKLFELGRLSSGKAARLAGHGSRHVSAKSASRGVAMLDLDETEMEAERQYARSE